MQNMNGLKKLVYLFFACASLAACNTQPPPQKSPECTAIETVYAIDKQIVSTSNTVSEVAAKSQSVALTGCPPEFIDAYRANVKAWQKLADIEKKMYTVNMTKAQTDIANFLSEYQSNPSKAAVELKRRWPSQAKAIDECAAQIASTRADYIAIGVKYDAVYNQNSGLF